MITDVIVAIDYGGESPWADCTDPQRPDTKWLCGLCKTGLVENHRGARCDNFLCHAVVIQVKYDYPEYSTRYEVF